MPYRVSSSRKHFELQVLAIKKNLKVADKKGVPSSLRDYAIAAAIFLAHAEIENYFIDVLARIANAYSKGISSASDLPQKLRAHLVVEKLNLKTIAAKVSGNSGEQDVLNFVERWFSSSNSYLINESKPLCAFLGEDIYGDYSYPSIRNLEKVLRRLGIGNPKMELNKTGKEDVISLLESLANLRTALAHSASLPGISCGDVALRINQVMRFVSALDKLLYFSLKSSVSDNYWKSSVCN